jgi:hypothetical protein
MTHLPDTSCPECHGPFTLVLAGPARLRKRCLDCGHLWSEEPTANLMQGNYLAPTCTCDVDSCAVDPACPRHGDPS